MPTRDGKQLAAIVGNQRSGTTALGRTIGKTPGIRYLGEIFHSVRGPQDDFDYRRFLTDPDANFFSFKEALVRRFPSLVVPLYRNQQAIWSEFKEHIFSLGPESIFVADIKYNSAHHLDRVWHDPLECPGLFQMLSSDAAPVLHIMRTDVFAQAVSLSIAQATGQWHRLRGDLSTAMKPIRIEPETIQRQVVRSQRLYEMFTGFLSKHQPLLELRYEDCFSREEIVPDIRRSIAAFLGLTEPISGSVDLVRMSSGTLRQRISNREEILHYFSGGELEALVTKHLA